MRVIVIWPYEIMPSNRTHYQRLKCLTRHFNVHLLTIYQAQIDDELKKLITIHSFKACSSFCKILFPFYVIWKSIALPDKDKALYYVFYNLMILPALIASISFRIKLFVDFLDDPEATPQILSYEKRGRLKRYVYLLANQLFKIFCRKTNLMLGCCGIGLNENSALPLIYRKRFNIESSRIIIVPNGTDSDVARLSKKRDDEILRIIYVGIIGKRRQTNILIDTLKELTSVKFEITLIGEILCRPDRIWIENEQKKNDWIKYLGPLPHKNVINALVGSDVGIFIAPSLIDNYRFTHPIKILEYMSVGLPVIAPRFPGTEEIVKNEKNGFLFNSENPSEICEIIYRQVENFKNHIFTTQAICCAKKFDWRIINDKFINDFTRLVNINNHGSYGNHSKNWQNDEHFQCGDS